jgi:beta-galactosidase
MWSIGNEIPEIGTPAVDQAARQLADHVRALDPTRPVTAGVNLLVSGLSGNNLDTFLSTLDIAGYNYAADRYEADHKAFPGRVMYASESFGPQIELYWDPVEKMPWVIGDFVWAAFDYMGEAGLGWLPSAPYPWHLSMSGEIDATGKMRPAAYYRSVYWKTGSPRTSAFVAWPTADGSLPNGELRGTKFQYYVQEDLVGSWAERQGVPAKVVVFSEDDEVELFANGKSHGRKPVSRATGYRTSYWVLLPKGEVKVVGYAKGKPNSEWVMHSSGTPAKIRLSVDRPRIEADGDDLAYITAELLDAQGAPVAIAKQDKKLSFRVSGAGTLAGVGNGNPVALESFQSGERSTYWGRAVIVVRAGRTPGPVTVRVTGEGLEGASTTILVE